jgi:hypothetical protein
MPTLAEILANLTKEIEKPAQSGFSLLSTAPQPKPVQTGFKISDAVADPMSAPFGWQTACPDDIFRKGDPVGGSTDLDRILALPRRAPLDLNSATAEAIVELEMAKYAKDNPNCRCQEIDPRRTCIKRMLPAQAWMLREIHQNQGLLAHMSVGAGKSFLDITAALALTDVKQVLLLIPASLRDQIQHDYQMIAQHFHVPGFIMHMGNEKPLYPTGAIPGRPTLHVLPYSRLSLAEESDFLNRLGPDAIIADECDAIRNPSSSRSLRVYKWFAGGETPEERQRRMATKFLGWTGSLTDHSITEFNYLSLFALRERSPLPLDPNVVTEWGRCLDATTNPSPPGELLKFCSPGEDVRHAFRRRLAETPGFIIANITDIHVTGGTGLVENDIREKIAPELPPIIVQALSMVRMGIRPDSLIPNPDGEIYGDEELEDALAIARAAQEVSTGVLYYLTFPEGEPTWLIKDYLKARGAYNREVREKTLEGHTFLDSAMLCEHAAMRYWGDSEKRDDRPEWRCEAYNKWKDIKDKVKPKPESCVLHDFIAQDAVEWGAERPGIIWYGMRALATKMQELSGLPVHDGGTKGGLRLRAEKGNRSIICSIKSNSRGRDGLQFAFDRQLIINPMASATGWEQLIGRAHRRGQRSQTVTTEIYLHTPELRKAVDQAMRRGTYVKEILGADQKLLDGWKGD